MDRTSSVREPARAAGLQDTLRRIERLVAQEADGQRVFDAVVEALGRTVDADAAWLIHFDAYGYVINLGAWSTRALSLPVGTRQALSDDLRELRRRAQAYRFTLADVPPGTASGDEARRLGIVSAVGVPVWLGGEVWALAVVVRFGSEPFPDDTESRLTAFVEPVTAALAHALTRAELAEWRTEQAALRRLAATAATVRGQDALLHAVVEEASTLVGGRTVLLARVEGDGQHGVVVAASDQGVAVGRRFRVAADAATARVVRSGRTERVDDHAPPPTGAMADGLRPHAVVVVPVDVDGRLWGVLAALSPDEPLPPGTEGRLGNVAEVAATALSTARTRGELQQLADEQAALLRVSKLVARGADENELFAAVAGEAARLVDQDGIVLLRLDGPRAFTVLATSGSPAEVGTRLEVARDAVDRTGAADDLAGLRHGLGLGAAVPVVVEGRLWGLLGGVRETRRPQPAAEGRLQQFAELVGAAIANSQARVEVAQLAEEQAALRRVAELVAREVSLPEVFAKIAVEASRLLGVGAALLRFDPDAHAEVVAAHRSPTARLGLRIPTTDPFIGAMFTAGLAERLADYEELGFAAAVQDLGLAAGVAVPVTVEGRVWGALKTSPSGAAVPPGADEEVVARVADKLEKFAALAAAAIANVENRTQLTASRARIVASADEARKRLQRDVHDGAQQRLVQTVLTLKLARGAARSGEPTDDLIEEALGNAERATAELRDIVHGILPASLSRGGLRRGIESVIADLPLPVELDFTAPRLPAGAELTAYFTVAEALTNVVKHAGASRAVVRVATGDGRVLIEVSDNGTGGADPARGSGLTGLADRVETAEGTLAITSPTGAGTTLRASFPVAGL